ncbi:MAG TPA: hypothetical protein VIS48_12955 [Candidatus Kryptonia bacterium]
MKPKDIVRAIKKFGPTTFIQLMGEVPGFVGDYDFRIGSAEQNAVMWSGMSPEAIAILENLIKSERVFYVPTVSGYYRFALGAVADEITKKEIDDQILSLPRVETCQKTGKRNPAIQVDFTHQQQKEGNKNEELC